MQRPPFLLITTVSLLAACAAPGPATEPAPFVLKPYVWFAGLEGDAVLAGGPGVPVDVDFDDVLDNLDSGLTLAAEVNPEGSNWSWLFDVQALSMEPDAGPADVDVDQLILEGDVAWSPPNTPNFQWLAGLRYTDLETSLELGPIDFDTNEQWIDPVFGVRGRKRFSDVSSFEYRADLGGFGVGSDFTYQLFAGFSAFIAEDVQLSLGYRHLYAEVEDGDFEWDMTTSGPIFGLIWGIGE